MRVRVRLRVRPREPRREQPRSIQGLAAVPAARRRLSLLGRRVALRRDCVCVRGERVRGRRGGEGRRRRRGRLRAERGAAAQRQRDLEHGRLRREEGARVREEVRKRGIACERAAEKRAASARISERRRGGARGAAALLEMARLGAHAPPRRGPPSAAARRAGVRLTRPRRRRKRKRRRRPRAPARAQAAAGTQAWVLRRRREFPAAAPERARAQRTWRKKSFPTLAAERKIPLPRPGSARACPAAPSPRGSKPRVHAALLRFAEDVKKSLEIIFLPHKTSPAESPRARAS